MFHSIKKLKKDSDPSEYRLWYNDWVKDNAKGKVLDVGKSTFWDYGFVTIDINAKLRPTIVGDVENMPFVDNEFDIVLCNGMIEVVSNPQKMINEVLRITKFGGTAIFGFVGENYKPYRKPWYYYSGLETFPNVVDYNIKRKNFGKEYYFIICKK